MQQQKIIDVHETQTSKIAACKNFAPPIDHCTSTPNDRANCLNWNSLSYVYQKYIGPKNTHTVCI